MKILLTGASGFLGSHLARHFLAAGHDVALLLRPGSRLDRLRGMEAAFETGRFENDAECTAFVRSVAPDVLVHTACAYGRRGESPVEMLESNVRFGLLLLQALEMNQLPATFMNMGTVLAPEVSLYALSKHQFAQWGRFMAGQTGSPLQFVQVLLQHMYGPGDDVSKFTTHVLHACQRSVPELKLTAGEQMRDFIHIEDAVSACALLAEQRQRLDKICEVEVGSGQAVSVRAFVEMAHRLSQSHTRLLFGALPYRAHEAMHCESDLSLLKQLGWLPRYDLEAGLTDTLEKDFPT